MRPLSLKPKARQQASASRSQRNKPPPPLQPVHYQSRNSGPPDINAIDHIISQYNGTSFALEFDSPKIQSAKQDMFPPAHVQIAQLTRDNGFLRQEVKFYRAFYHITNQLNATAYDVYKQLFLTSYFPPDAERLHQLTLELHHGLEHSWREQVAAEKEWRAFWDGVY